MTTKSALFAIPLALAGWISVLGTVGYFTDEAPAYVVPLPSVSLLNNLPEGAAILSMNDWSITLVSEQSEFAKSLYEAGATLVLPAGLAGCAALTVRDFRAKRT